MKSAITIFSISLFLFLISCADEEIEGGICCAPRPSRLTLVVEKDTEKAQYFIKDGEIDKKSVYLYKMNNGLKVRLADSDVSNGHRIYIHCELSSVYESMTKGVSTVYLQLLDNQTDTLVLDLEEEEAGVRYSIRGIKINGKSAIRASSGIYYLDPPNNLNLLVEENSKVGKKFVVGNTITLDEKKMYFYRVENEQKVKWKIPFLWETPFITYGQSSPYLSIVLEKSSVYPHLANKGLSTVYLQLDQQTDTIQLKVTKKEVNGYPHYAVSEVKVNGKPGVPFPACGYKQHCYYLNPPSNQK